MKTIIPRTDEIIYNEKKKKINCMRCGASFEASQFYSTENVVFGKNKKIPICKDCLNKIFDYYSEFYKKGGYPNHDNKAMKKICMMLDVYYSPKIVEMAVKRLQKYKKATFITSYMVSSNITQFKNKTYEDTIIEDENQRLQDNQPSEEDYDEMIKNKLRIEVNEDTREFFGYGYTAQDYYFLQKEFNDWVDKLGRNISKAQEILLKELCHTELDLQKARENGEDVKDIQKRLQTLLGDMKLQPRQNDGSNTDGIEPYGVRIMKYENTKPLPDIDEELKDVDNIAQYIDVFFRGHLAKMTGLKNALSNLYEKYIKNYSAEKDVYVEDEDSETIFNKLFGNKDKS